MTAPFYFKQLDIPYDQSEILNFFNSNDKHDYFKGMHPRDVVDYLPSIFKWFDEQNLTPNYVAYIATKNQFKQVIHIDSGYHQLAINFPIFNCETIKTSFYEVDKTSEKTFISYPSKLIATEYTNYISTICSYVLTKPTLLNLKMPHSVDNNTDSIRYALSFRFKEDPINLM